MKLDDCNSIADLRRMAQSRLPGPVFHYMDGGADDEWSLRRNTVAFDNFELLPRCLRNVEEIDLRTSVLGTTLKLPIILSPTGMSRLFHHDKELGVAKAADRFGALYSLSTMATTSIEEIAEVCSGPKMFQIYILRDRGLTEEFLARCKEAGYQAMCLTVDLPVAGNRERDVVHGMTMPPRFRLTSLWSFATHFRWAFNLFRHPGFRLANVEHRVDAIGAGTISLIDYANAQFDRSITWEDAAWLVEQWPGPFVIKGILTPGDARRAVEIGASAIMISNHGGRQLDTTPAPVDCIQSIRDAVGDAVEIIVDGGIRRGTHILKALALGADACAVGRAHLFGLGAGGQAGVERALYLLRDELLRDMALLGCTSLDQVTEANIRQAGHAH